MNDEAAFDAECDQLLGSIVPSATQLDLSLAGITSLTDRLAMLGKLKNDVGHCVRYFDVRSYDLVGRPSKDDIAQLAVEGMLGVAAAKLSARTEAGGSDASVAKRALERLFVEYSQEEKA